MCRRLPNGWKEENRIGVLKMDADEEKITEKRMESKTMSADVCERKTCYLDPEREKVSGSVVLGCAIAS